ncbi:AraC family transcriptional regulator [Ciceribacter selenitireducens]|nr:AraC family transcriptional regulator [Ciceribacter selenitireducens]
MALTLDPALVATLLADLPKPAAGGVQDGAFSVAPVTGELLDA